MSEKITPIGRITPILRVIPTSNTPAESEDDQTSFNEIYSELKREQKERDGDKSPS